MGPQNGYFQNGGATIAPIQAQSPFVTSLGAFSSSGFVDKFQSFVSGLEVFLSFLSIFFMLAIIYIVIQRNVAFANAAITSKALKKKDEEGKVGEEKGAKVREMVTESAPLQAEVSEPSRFDRVLEHLHSKNIGDWRIAIIEADNILYEILRRSGFPGETLGEMLTNANSTSFRTLENAWEAHKTRNLIAHETMNFDLTHREAKRIIGLYENVFREFRYL